MTEKKINISESLAGLLQKMDKNQVGIVQNMFQHYMEQYEYARTTADGASVAFEIHNLVDQAMQELIANETEYKVSCRQGCSFCCYQRVDISDDEAALILKYADEIRFEIDFDLLKRQAETKDEKEFMALRHRHRKCAFLNDNSCSIYEHRPSACRKLVVISDPNLCDTVKNKGAEIGKLVSVEAEVVTSSALNIRESGSMAEMILKQKENLTK